MTDEKEKLLQPVVPGIATSNEFDPDFSKVSPEEVEHADQLMKEANKPRLVKRNSSFTASDSIVEERDTFKSLYGKQKASGEECIKLSFQNVLF